MYNDLSISHLNGIDFKYIKSNGAYQLKVTQGGKNITSRFVGLAGIYDSDADYLVINTSSIESICCYLIECYKG